MKTFALRLGLLALAFAPMAAMADSTSYSFQTVVNPGDTAFTQLLGINNGGTIAGYFGDGTTVPNNGFTLVLPNSFTPENFPGSLQTQVVGINNSGETVGFWIDEGGVQHGFTDVAGTFQSVDNPNTTTVTQLLGVNNSGRTAGYWTDGGGKFHPFTWSGGTFTPLSFSGELSAQATDVNDAGTVVGFNMTATSTLGFLDVGGVFTSIDCQGSAFTQAFGLNNMGEVVGSYLDAGGVTHGFVYNTGTGSCTAVDDPSAVGSTVINGINDKGQIVGFYTDANGNTDGFVATPQGTVATPEPGSLILLSAGLVGLLFGRRLRRSPA